MYSDTAHQKHLIRYMYFSRTIGVFAKNRACFLNYTIAMVIIEFTALVTSTLFVFYSCFSILLLLCENKYLLVKLSVNFLVACAHICFVFVSFYFYSVLHQYRILIIFFSKTQRSGYPLTGYY